MIKHDYKPHNNKRLFEPRFYDRIPAWATHPFIIFATASLVMMSAILLSKDKQTDQELIEGFITEISATNPNTDSQSSHNSLAQERLSKNQFASGELNDPSSSASNLIHNNNFNDANYSDPIELLLEFDSVAVQDNSVKTDAISDLWEKEPVLKGDNLSLIFQRIGLSPQMVYKVSTLDKNTKKLTRLQPGEVIHYQLDQNKQLKELKYVMDLQNTLYLHGSLTEQDGKYNYTSEIINKSIELRTAYTSGTITDSLFLSGKRAGLSDPLIINFANIFAWDIDFILDIRSGDSFSLLYQEKYLDGEKIGNGDIIVAEFINRGKTLKAIRYTDSKNNTNYYSDTGHSMRKAFLRAPVNFKYISDGFNPKRFHPVQKRIKPHRGIDYAAPTGTPIRASGDGKVIASGYNKFNGKYVFIQHGNSIITKYLHLSRRLVSRGKRVKQGQTIGKLGSTGMVTGAHLHYEFVVNGVHRNPRTVKLPKAEPIPKSEEINFLIESKALVSQLETRKHIQSIPQVAK